MKKDVIIFQNSTKYLNEGTGISKGILYCHSEYTKKNYCSCGACDGHCNNGCACPDCENALSYLLYSTGKMLCEKCNKTLIRINIYNLKNILKSNNIPNPAFKCNICNKSFCNELYIPLMHCMKCNFDMCPSCAFEKLISLTESEWNSINIDIEKNAEIFYKGKNSGLGNIYCGKNFTEKNFCLCGTCDGNCGPTNGCPCPKCDAVLGYNLYLKKNGLKCDKCGSLLIKTKLGFIKKEPKFEKINLKCFLCNEDNNNQLDFQNIYFCYKCKHNVCQKCAYEKNIKDIKDITLPKLPIIFFENEIRKTIKNNKNKNLKICNQYILSLRKKNENGKDICIYLKTLIGKIYTININDSEYVWKIFEKMKKIDNKFKEDNTILYYNSNILDNNDFICDYQIGNENVINIMIKS